MDQRVERFHPSSKQGDQRSETARDRDRVLHSSAFRRLDGVTQVVSATEGHVFHNRLTHSLKVAQIGRRLAELMRAKYRKEVAGLGGCDPEVVDAAGLLHDLGHPPFGHLTEKELDETLRAKEVPDGYEGNAQAFRIATKLAIRDESFPGWNLTRATLNAMLKYPWLRSRRGKDPKSKKWGAYDSEAAEHDWCREPLARRTRKTLEAGLMDISDDIAYSVHDAEDFFRAGLVPLDKFADVKGPEFVRIKRRLEKKGKDPDALKRVMALFPIDQAYVGTAAQRAHLRKWASTLIQRYVTAVRVDADADADDVVAVPEPFEHEIHALKEFVWEYVIERPSLASQQHGLRRVVRDLFEIYHDAIETNRPSLLPPRFGEELERGLEKSKLFGQELDSRQRGLRLAADIVASFTDAEALVIHHRLTGIAPGSVTAFVAV